jgi:hypothetical protein
MAGREWCPVGPCRLRSSRQSDRGKGSRRRLRLELSPRPASSLRRARVAASAEISVGPRRDGGVAAGVDRADVLGLDRDTLAGAETGSAVYRNELSREQQAELNARYWGSDEKVPDLAARFGLEGRCLHKLVSALPAGIECDRCGVEIEGVLRRRIEVTGERVICTGADDYPVRVDMDAISGPVVWAGSPLRPISRQSL